MVKFSKLFVIPILLTCFLFIMLNYYNYTQNIMFLPWNNLVEQQISEDVVDEDVASDPANKTLKTILLWNSPHRIEVSAFGTGHQPFIDAGCPISNCLIEANSSEFWNRATANDSEILKSFDAVVINIHELWLSSLPVYDRPTGQRLVWLTQESPQTTSSFVNFDSHQYDSLFNWTMTYKRDSDIQFPYGRVERIANQTKDAKKLSKEKMAALETKSNDTIVGWMVSHCNTNSKREDYVHQLQKHIQVDIYGGCGNLSHCPRDKHWISEPQCYDMISRKYKFYLSFENSFCKDYVTEKFFSILELDVVPIVFGAADYEAIAPEHSFINALNFSSPAKLAEYLHFLNENGDLYLDYFDWKSHYRVEASMKQMSSHAFCDLCAKLNREDEPSKVYDSMVPHWSASTQCSPAWTSGSTPSYYFNSKAELFSSLL